MRFTTTQYFIVSSITCQIYFRNSLKKTNKQTNKTKTRKYFLKLDISHLPLLQNQFTVNDNNMALKCRGIRSILFIHYATGLICHDVNIK